MIILLITGVVARITRKKIRIYQYGSWHTGDAWQMVIIVTVAVVVLVNQGVIMESPETQALS